MPWFLPHHDVHQRVLLGDDLQHLVEVTRDALPPAARERRGFWVDPGGERVLLVATRAGPVIRVAEQTLPMADVTITLDRGDSGHRRCTLSAGGRLLADIRYPAPPHTGGGWEADEGSTDFFVWLADNAGSESFRAFYSEVD